MTRSIILVVAGAFLISAAVATGLQLGVQRADAQSVDANRAAVLLQRFDALNRGDVDAYMAAVPMAPFAVGSGATGACSQATPCSDRDAIRAYVMPIMATPHLCETVTSIGVNGSIVTGRIEVRSDTARARGIERTVSWFMADVRDGLIYSYFLRNDLADPQTALNAAITAGTAQPAPSMPTPDPPCG
jgi:hypothetical protein